MNVEYEVTVAGPGECVSGPATLIAAVLAAAGFKVTVHNEFPITLEQLDNVLKNKPNGNAVLNVVHEPWGG